MKAIVIDSFGGPEALKLSEIAAPQAGPGEVRVKVMAAGVMPIDGKIRQGYAPPGAAIALPFVPGNEFAGIVDQVGEGVTAFAAGDAVLGFGTLGSYAEYRVASADQIVRKPAAMPWETAGGFSGNGQGAHMALSAIGIRPGDTVLIHGAAGGLGTFAVQLALAWGADTVIGTASERNHAYLRELGAIPVAYGEGLEERVRAVAPKGVDAAFAAVDSEEALRVSAALVADKSRIRSMLSRPLIKELGIPPLEGARSAARLSELVKLYEEGKVDVRIRRVYALREAELSHREIDGGHGSGKIVLRIGETG
ncbi:NADPH:quinone reductase [Cohnella sp. OV330]|uniref:NADP-dependent oxidoreductase n=1 Tax=Cohnella sp. OV330 TaxID=1855288 RepID=UPI0008E3B4BE|nr:NADP-dependent oxidoreductase [Cohnella sp. OV330]SFB08865.1 NADPH:quinone reductase [Cohnella sp. OV330]